MRKYGISHPSFYRWKGEFEGMEVSDARRLRQLESENMKLKKIVAEQALAIQNFQEFLKKGVDVSTPPLLARPMMESGIPEQRTLVFWGIHRCTFRSMKEAQVVEWWRRYSNEERPHSSFGYKTPGEFTRLSRSRAHEGSGKLEK